MIWHDIDKKRPPVSGDEYLILQDIGRRFCDDPLHYAGVEVATYYDAGERLPLKEHEDEPSYWISVGAFYRQDEDGYPIPVYGVRYWAKLPKVPLEFLGDQNRWRAREED